MSWNPFAKKLKDKEILLPVSNVGQEPVYSRVDLKYLSPHLKQGIKKKIQAHYEQPPIISIDGIQRGVDGVLRYRIKTIDDDYNLGHQEQTEIKQAHCANCGAPLNPTKARCEYCNSYYREEIENYVLESL